METINILKFTADNKVVPVTIQKNYYKDYAEAIGNGCNCIDIQDCTKDVALEQYCLIFDDEFLFNFARPPINIMASYMFGLQYHGQPLCGNVLVAKNYVDENGELTTVGLDKNDIDILYKFALKNYVKAYKATMDFMAKVATHSKGVQK